MRTTIACTALTLLLAACSGSLPIAPGDSRAGGTPNGTTPDGTEGSGGRTTDTTLPLCQALKQDPRMQGCAVMMPNANEAAAMDTAVANGACSYSHQPVDFTITGTVTAIHSVIPEGGCLACWAANRSDLGSDIVALEVVDATSVRWDVEYIVPYPYKPWAIGDSITVAYAYSSYSPFARASSLSVSRGGAVLVYVVNGLGTGDAKGTPVHLAEGVAECQVTQTCGTWQRREVLATSGDSSIGLKTSASASVGGYRVVNGQLADTIQFGSCEDGGFDYFEVAMTADDPAK